MKNMNLKEKGITIISLVVTIIILLILAGVTISSVTGDNGLFRKAKEAVEESKKAEYQEELTTIGLGIKLEKSSTPINNKEYVDLFEEEMNRQIIGNGIFKDSKIRRKNDETLRVETKEGYIYYVREDEAIYIGKAGEVDESEVPDITIGDIKFNYSKEEWTNEDVTVEIAIGEEVENKENYVIEYSKDAKNWTRYIEPITMTTNGEIYARAKDKLGDIKVEKYATGEVQNIDKNAPTPGTIIMKMASSKAPYTEGTEVYQNVIIELENGEDNEGESGHKATTCTITGLTGITSISKEQGPVLLKARDGNYIITAEIKTKDNAGNEVTIQKEYTIRTIYAKETKELTTTDGTYYLPEGFKLAEDSATQISEGIVVEDKNENQWVWVPCYVEGGVNEEEGKENKVDKYDRYVLYDGDDVTTNFVENLPTDERNSIKLYGGFFIGRYEAGDKESTQAKEMRTAGKYYNSGAGDATHTVTIKRGQAPYEYVTYNQSVTLAKNIKEKEGYKQGITKLTSGYAWDTAIKFVERTIQNFGSEPLQNTNMACFTGFKYIDITGKEQSKNEVIVIPTGQTPPTCNIYDLCGNVCEFSSETYVPDTYGTHVVLRGTRNSSSAASAGIRIVGWGTGNAYSERGFRPAYFL